MGEKEINDTTVKLYIGGVDPDWPSEKIKSILEQHGNVIRVDVVKNFAFGFVRTQADAEKIIKECNGKVFFSRKLNIQISKNKQNLPDCDELCFECGKAGHWAKECAQRRQRMQEMAAKRGGRGGGRGGGRDGGGGRGSGRDAYNGRDYPDLPPRDRDPYARDLPPRYRRDPYARYDPYERDLYARDPYLRDPYYRDPYVRDPYYARDPYYERLEAARYYRERSPPPTATYDYARRSPPPRSAYSREADPYAAARERLAYGRSYDPLPPASTSSRLPPPADPYETARRALSTYDEVRRAADPYGTAADPRRSESAYASSAAQAPARDQGYTSFDTPSASSGTTRPADPARPADPYDMKTAQDRYATAESGTKRYPEPAPAPAPRPTYA